MLQKIILFSLILLLAATSVQAQVPVNIGNKSIDSLYYKSKTYWITFTPFFFVDHKFSPDQGKTWQDVGMFGQNVKPLAQPDSMAYQNIRIYSFTRAAGIAQMWVIAPLLAYKHYADKGDVTSYGNDDINDNIYREEQTAYLPTAVLIFLTGTFTYHVLSKTFLFRSLHDYNHAVLGNEPSFHFTINLDRKTNIPQLSLVLTF
ncbi:MAG: hypothetical protein V2I54_06465 [Bacteroidales bacterium]|jgi:hypothetical protein|nr:hypothetical protein [Bacteroidales bacterium]